MPNAPSNQAEYKYLSTDKLKFDPGNPRFFGSQTDQKKTQSELYQVLNKRFWGSRPSRFASGQWLCSLRTARRSQ